MAYFGSFSAVSIAAIQAFWLAASGEADRMANLPPSGPRIFSAMSAMTLPVSVKSTWATNTSSPSADGIGESQVTTLMPLACAALAAGTIWSPELLEIMIALTPCVVALVTISICPATLFSGVGPRILQCRRVLQFLGGFLGALVRLVERQDAEEFRQQHHADVLARRRHRPAPIAACGSSGTAARSRGGQQQLPHVLSLSICLWMSCAMFGTSTDRISRPPITLVWVLPVMSARPMPLRRLRITRMRQPDPDQIARTAEDADAAEQHDGDDVELEALRHVAAHRAEPRRIQQPGERRDDAGRRRTAQS